VTDDLTARLTNALDALANTYDPDIPHFDPDRRPSVTLPEDEPSRHPRRWLVAAAVLVIGALAAAVTVAIRHDTSAGPDDVRMSDDDKAPRVEGARSVPTGALVPTVVPDGLELWNAGGTDRPEETLRPGRYQLFGTPGEGPAVLVVIEEDGFGDRKSVV